MLVFGDDPKDREVVLELAKAAGLRGIHAGPLANSVAAEALTSVLIGINRTYKVDGAGIRITGIAAHRASRRQPRELDLATDLGNGTGP